MGLAKDKLFGKISVPASHPGVSDISIIRTLSWLSLLFT